MRFQYLFREKHQPKNKEIRNNEQIYQTAAEQRENETIFVLVAQTDCDLFPF